MRPHDWEKRLAEQLKIAATRPYNSKTWNCARFAHACAEAVSGRPILYRRKGGLEASVDAVLERVGTRQALRGDVVLAKCPRPALGVCIGAKAAFLAKAGLLTIPMREVSVAWRV